MNNIIWLVVAHVEFSRDGIQRAKCSIQYIVDNLSVNIDSFYSG